MVLLITGASHTGKTLLAQRLLERYGWTYLSLDHLKMGLIRSGMCTLTPESPEEDLTSYLWTVVREIIKTAIENGQNLIVEGCYIPQYWEMDFTEYYQEEIRYLCLIFSPAYVLHHFADITAYENIIERRCPSLLNAAALKQDNQRWLRQSQEAGYRYVQITDHYNMEIDNIRLDNGQLLTDYLGSTSTT